MKKLSATYGRTILTGVAGLAGIIALLVLSLVNEYQNANLHARVEVENISRVLEEHALATVHKADLLLREVQRNVRPDDMRPARGMNGPRARELHALLKSQLENVPEVAVLHVTDAQGNHIYSSLDPVPRINIADRYHFTRHRDDATAGLVISPPLVSRTTKKWTLVLTRRLSFEDGSFAGIVNVILNLDYFGQFYRSLNLGTHGLVALYDKEQRLAARFPPSEKDMGEKVPNHPLQPYIEKGVRSGVYHTRSPLDGLVHEVSFRQLRDLPLIVLAGIAEEDYLAEWRRHIWQYGTGAVIFCLVVTGFGLRQRRAEEQLRAASNYARSLIEASLDPLVTIRADGKIMDVNSATEKVTGRGRDRLIGSDFSEYFTAPEQAREGYRRVFSQGQVTDYPLSIRHASGLVTEVLYNAAVYRNEQGEIAGIFAAARDVTSLKRAENQLRAASHYSRSLIEASLDPLVTISAEGKIMDVNSATEKVTGVPRDQLIGSDFSEYFTEPEKARAGYRQVFSQGQVIDYPLAIRHASGWVTEVLYNAAVYRNEQGEIAGVFAAARDVTDLRRVGDQLRAASHYSRSLIEASLDPLVTINAEGKITDVNRATEKVTGIPRDRLVGSDFSDYFTEPEKARSGYRQVFSEGQVTDYPLAIRHVSGMVTDVLYNASIYSDAQGNVAGVFAAARDITERNRRDEEIRLLNETLEQRVQDETAKRVAQERLLIQQSRLAAMGEMIGNIAHQWRQPINALALMLANIQDAYAYNELTQEFLDSEVKIGQNLIQKMSSTIDDFRNFFKPNKEKQNFRPSNAVAEALKLVQQSFKNNNISITFEDGDEPCQVSGYPNEFAQVVLNALSNAKDVLVEKKSGGSVVIRIEPGEASATVSIHDSGGGIPEAILPKVFDPYFTTKEKGTGIGLYMSKMIMDNMDGDIVIRNVEGGAEVSLTLPLAELAV